MNRLKQRGEQSGAVAVMVALLAVLLFSIAALAVDIGNAWARKRAVQKQVDVSAIAAGWMLPMTTANELTIANKVAEYLNEDDNQATGQSDVTGADLIDSDPANGHITWLDSDGQPCTDNCTRMEVLAPSARVDFGFAAVMGFSGTDVQRSATVEVMSPLPPAAKTIPFWLPTGCGYGPTEADTTGGGPHGAPAALDPADLVLPGGAVVPTPTDKSIDLTGTPVTMVNFQGTGTLRALTVKLGNSSFKKISLRAFAPDGSKFVDYGVELPGNGAVPDVHIGTEISAMAGDWAVYVLAEKANGDKVFSDESVIIRVINGPSPTASPTATPTASPTADPSVSPMPTPTPTVTATGDPAGCVGPDRGNFGQLGSPHHLAGNLQQSLQYNIALGLDHQLVPYIFPPSVPETKDCGKHSPTIPGGKFDDKPGAEGNGANCIKGDTGNDGPKMYDGFLGGISASVRARLEGSNTCTGRPSIQVNGHPINNDTLACFLRGSGTLAGIAQMSGVDATMLSPEIVDSPRFVWIPVVYASDRAQKDFQPIRNFVPGFITEETQTSGPNDAGGHINGFEINGNSIKVLHVYTFNPAALPPNEQAPTTAYDPELGGAIVRLVG